MADRLPMLAALSLEEVELDEYLADHQAIPSGRAYGGEVLAQAVAAAMRTVADDRSIHSFHGYFLRGGVVDEQTRYSVERVRDGRHFSVRAVRGIQQGRTMFTGLASFHVPTEGVRHQDELPAGLPAPESLPTSASAVAGSRTRDTEYWSHYRSFDIRHCEPAVYLRADPHPQPGQVVWVKAYEPMPDDPNLHRAALAYLCDYTLLETVLRQHGAAWAQPGVVTASLDHAMWWHQDGRADEWIAVVQDSPAAGRGLGSTRGRLFSRDGMLLATVAQEGLVALPAVGAGAVDHPRTRGLSAPDRSWRPMDPVR